MTRKLRLSPTDRLTLNARHYRFLETTQSGYLFLSMPDEDSTIGLTVEEIDDCLASPDGLLERGYYEPGDARRALDHRTDFLQNLDEETRSLVLWRHQWVVAFLRLRHEGKVRSTRASVANALPMMAPDIAAFEHAQQRNESSERAGQKRFNRAPPRPSTLLKWVRLYDDAGDDVRALVPRYHSSGNVRDRFCALTERLLCDAIQAYASFQGPTKRQVWQKCVQQFKDVNLERENDGLPRLAIPSRKTVERRISRMDPYTVYAQRKGAAAAGKRFLLYEDGIKARYPMERVEIDEWQVDVITLLDSIGVLNAVPPDIRKHYETTRRWLYVAIDVATRCVLGMRLAERPNVSDAVRTLAEVTRDKTDLAMAAGCTSSWAQGGGLGAVVTDQGSAFIDDLFRSIVLDLRGTGGTPPAGLAWLRGVIERVFLTFGTQLMPLLAGRTFSNPQERGDYPSESLAVHTDESLMRVLTLHVVDIYHNTPHQGLSGETPANCWTRLVGEVGTIPFPSAIERCAVFGIPETRKVTGRGVRVLGVDYVCDALRELHKRAYGSSVSICVNPENLGWILVRTGPHWVVAKAIQRSFDGVALGQWRLASRELRLRFDQQAELSEEVIARALRQIEEINSEQMRKFNITIPSMTPADLAREERQLHLGLTIQPEEQHDLNLPATGDLPGVEVPMPDVKPDLFNQNPAGAEPEPSKDQDRSAPARWGLEDDL